MSIHRRGSSRSATLYLRYKFMSRDSRFGQEFVILGNDGYSVTCTGGCNREPRERTRKRKFQTKYMNRGGPSGPRLRELSVLELGQRRTRGENKGREWVRREGREGTGGPFRRPEVRLCSRRFPGGTRNVRWRRVPRVSKGAVTLPTTFLGRGTLVLEEFLRP